MEKLRKWEFKFDLNNISKYRQEIYGITILWIMIHHGTIMDKVSYPEQLKWLYVILTHGNVGVDIFLFLSGMGIYYSFVKDNRLDVYIKKRLVKILIPYCILGGTYYIYADIILRQSVRAFIKDFSLMSFVCSGNKLVWYVLMILFCYIIFPYVYNLFYKENGEYKKNFALKVIVLIVAVVLLTFVMMKSYGKYYSNIEIALTRVPVFILGVASGKMVRDGKKISGIWVVVAALIVICSYPIFINYIFKGIYQRYYYCFLGIALIIVFAWLFTIIKWNWLHNVMKWFGAISFELYLAHILLRNIFLKSSMYSTYVYKKYFAMLIIAIVVAVIAAKIGNIIIKLISRQK